MVLLPPFKAGDAAVLRSMLDQLIESYVDRHQLAGLEVAEADERRVLERIAGVAS